MSNEPKRIYLSPLDWQSPFLTERENAVDVEFIHHSEASRLIQGAKEEMISEIVALIFEARGEGWLPDYLIDRICALKSQEKPHE